MLTENTMDTYSFFNLFSKHINKYKEEKIKVNESYHYYIEYLFRNFFRIFFEKINLAPDKYNIWEHYFPPTLKIHSVTVVSDLLQRAVFNEYFQWAEGRIGRTNKKKEFDESLDDVSEHLFPEIDPTLWAEILTFIFSPYLPNGHLKYFIEQDQIIFGSARFRSYGGYIENDKDFQKKAQELWGASAKSERKNTIKMVITLFGQIFTEKNLIDLIKQGESLNYTSEPEKENRKNILVDIFRELLNYQQSKKNANQY